MSGWDLSLVVPGNIIGILGAFLLGRAILSILCKEPNPNYEELPRLHPRNLPHWYWVILGIFIIGFACIICLKGGVTVEQLFVAM